jgi:tetratricopeptide (TPR) repeat protein
MKRELLLLFAVHQGNDVETDSLIGVLDAVTTASQPTLSTVAVTARASGKTHVAIWAYAQLRKHHEPARRQIIVPLAECLVSEKRTEEAAALLDSFLEAPGVPESYRDQARLIQARLVYRYGEETQEALGLLRDIEDRRARTEADLLAAIIRFLESGNDSLAHRLETTARMRPDIKEANDAFDLARLSPYLPTDNSEKEAVLHALRLDIRERWESAARAYLSIVPALKPPLFSHVGIRGARCLERAGEFEKALEVWDQVIDADVDVAVALLGKGDCQTSMGLADSAKAVYMTILRQYPESPHAARARSRLLD